MGEILMEEFQPISQVKNMRSGINTKGVVKSMNDPRTVNLKSGQQSFGTTIKMDQSENNKIGDSQDSEFERF